MSKSSPTENHTYREKTTNEPENVGKSLNLSRQKIVYMWGGGATTNEL